MTGSIDEVHRLNADAWNETSTWYALRAEQLRNDLAAGNSTLHRQEHKLLQLLPPLSTWCETAVHLQCSAGFDTISLANLGARQAIGVDISPDLVDIATNLGGQVGAPVTFRCADVVDVRGLEGQADLIYTGKGAVHWMFDLTAWATKLAEVLRPGGVVAPF